MKLPYGSAATIGMFVTSLSCRQRPSLLEDCRFTDAHVEMPAVPLAEPGYVCPAGRPPSSSPVATGLPVVESHTAASAVVAHAYSRRKTWCEGCDVYVWL